MKMTWMSVLLVAGLTTSVYAAVPNQFQPGTPARAADINANFSNLDGRASTLETKSANADAEISALQTQQTDQAANIQAIDGQMTALASDVTALQSSAASFHFVDATGQLLGKAITLFFGPPSALVLLPIQTSWGQEQILVRVAIRFLFSVYSNAGVYYATADCSGQAFVADWSPGYDFGGMTPYSLENSNNDTPFALLVVANATGPSARLSPRSIQLAR